MGCFPPSGQLYSKSRVTLFHVSPRHYSDRNYTKYNSSFGGPKVDTDKISGLNAFGFLFTGINVDAQSV